MQSCLPWLWDHGIKTPSHSWRGLAPESLPVTHQWCNIEPSSAVQLIILWGRVTSDSNPVIFGKQRAKVSWMSGVSRGGPGGSGFICIMPNGLWMCLYVPSTPHACSLLDLSIFLRDVLICKENKHHQKDGKYKELVIIKVGKAGKGSFPQAQMDSEVHQKSRLLWRGFQCPSSPGSLVVQWSGTKKKKKKKNQFTGTAATNNARPKGRNGSGFKRPGNLGKDENHMQGYKGSLLMLLRLNLAYRVLFNPHCPDQ